MGDYLSFRKFAAPVLIQVIYWTATVAAILGGIVVIINSTRYYFNPDVFFGILLLILGPVAIRLWAEFLMAVFQMKNNLSDLRDVAIRDAYERAEKALKDQADTV